ncbi:MAG: hydroxysqualene dehydroxylase HpnE [Betaproteobacteria bacterium]|nr:hydroxysqualene dehydroxylase HpnE [Betaproteobacteria bacterium]
MNRAAGGRRVAVVGAGYAGIAAAVSLVQGGAAVTLFDANRTAGGRARRVEYRGAVLDNGQHILLGAYRRTLALMHAVGVPVNAVRRESLAIHYPGLLEFAAPRLPAPLHLAAALAFAHGLGFMERSAAFAFAFALRRAEAAAREGETVAGLLQRHAQPETLRRLVWEPLCVAALNTPADRADARVFARVLRDALMRGREDSELVLPAFDLSSLLPDPAISWLGERGAEIVLGGRILSLAREAAQWRLSLSDGARAFDAVVCATAPHEAASLLGTVPTLAPLAARISAIAHEPITTVYLQYDARVRLPFPMTGLDGGHAQWLFDREALGGPRGLVAAVISASRAQAALDHDVLATAVHREVERLGGTLDPPRWTKVITEKRATFACVPGAYRPPADTGAPGLVLAGDYTEGPYPATLEAAVQSGERAAHLLLGV